MSEYALAVIGAGPAGQMAAKRAALLGRNVAIIDRMSTGESPQRRIRRVLFRLYALEDAGLLETVFQPAQKSDEANRQTDSTTNEDQDDIEDPRLTSSAQHVAAVFFEECQPQDTDVNAMRKQLQMQNLTLLEGSARFLNIDELQIEQANGKKSVIEPNNVIIATGSSYVREEGIAFDGRRIHDAQSIFQIEEIPQSIVIAGEHEVPVQFAIAFALMGSRVTLYAPRKNLFEGLDESIAQSLDQRLQHYGVNVIFNHQVSAAQWHEGSQQVRISLQGIEDHLADHFLWLGKRVANISKLDVGEAGVELDEDQNIVADQHFNTSVGHIYAVGDVIRSPIYESTRKDQGRLAAGYMFSLQDTERLSDGYPVGIYTLPEVAFYGYTEAEAKKERIPCISATATYASIPYGMVSANPYGFLKLVVHREMEEVIGVHIIGRSAQEIIHFGMQLVEDKVQVGRIIGTVFNGKTLHELYHYAAMQAHAKLR